MSKPYPNTPYSVRRSLYSGLRKEESLLRSFVANAPQDEKVVVLVDIRRVN